MTTEIKNDNAMNNSRVSPDRAEGALIGAAIGDALGWPQERLNLRLGKGSRQPKTPQIAFQKWQRKSGSRYRYYKETIEPGEYSDDTQLILAVARSLLQDSHWSKFFAGQELPIWLLYQRGGGSAVLAAARSWSKNISPWKNSSVVKRYFATGANGAAMRIIPHAIISYQSEANMQTQVMLNSVFTHGHPRAILGAMLYVHAAYFLLRLPKTLEFGALPQYLLDTQAQWSQMREWKYGYTPWLEAAQAHTPQGYEALWMATVKELNEGLKACQEALKTGALASSRDFLTKLRAFDKQVSGAGTIAALAAIYLSSLYASDPVTGLLEAAFAHGADTDTIASMTGGLIGALLGTDWIKPEWREAQDYAYISNIAVQLTQVNVKKNGSESSISNWREDDNKRLIKQLTDHNSSQPEKIVMGPLGKVDVLKKFQWEEMSQRLVTHCWKLKTAPGQTIYVTNTIEDATLLKTTSRQSNFLSKKSTNGDLLISKLFDRLEPAMPAFLSVTAGFKLVRDTALILEKEKQRLGAGTFKTSLEDKSYISSIAKSVQEKGNRIYEKDLLDLINRVSEHLF